MTKVLIAELDIDTGNVIKEQKELGKEIAELKEQLKLARKEGNQYTEDNIKADAKLKTLNTTYRANQRVLQGLAATQTGQVKTIREARSVVSALTVEWQKSAAINGENDERTVKLAQKLEFLNKKINENKLSVGDSTSNIGKYNKNLDQTINAVGGIPGPMGGAIKSIKALGVAILANPIGIFVAALAGAGKALQSFFTGSEEGQERWNVMWTKTKTILGNVGDAVRDVGKGIADLNKNVDESGEKLTLWQRTQKSVREEWDKTKALAKEVKEKGLFKTIGDIAKEASEAVKESVNAIVEETKRELAIAENLANRQNKLRRDERKQLVERAQLQTDIADLILKSRDRENVSNEEALKAIQDATKLKQKEFDEEVRIAEERLKLKEIENSLSDSTREDLDEQAQLQAELIRLEKTRADQVRELLNRETEIRNRITAERKAEADRAKKEAEEAQKLLDEQIAKEKEIADQKKEQDLIDQENRLLALEEGLNKEFELRQFALDAQREQEIEAAEQIGGDVQAVKDKYARAEVELEKAKEQAKLSLVAGFAGNIKQIFGESTKVGKAAAIAETAINTYKSAQAAYASLAGIPVVGPALGIAAAGAAVAAGIKNIQKIRSINPAGGGGSISGGGAASASSSGVSIPSPSSNLTTAADFSSGIVTSGTQQQAAQRAATQEGLEKALENSPPVLVKEDFEVVDKRTISVEVESEQ